MLMSLQALWSRHMQAVSSGFFVLCQKPFLTAMTVLVIGITLTIPALFGIMVNTVKHFNNSWNDHNHLSVYLVMKLKPNEMTKALQTVRALEEVASATLQTPEQGLVAFEQQEGMVGVAHLLPDNPLPAMIEVIPKAQYTTPIALKRLAMRLKTLSFVDQVKVDLEWIGRLYTTGLLLKRLLQGMMMILIGSVILIIGNTLRLTFLQRQEALFVLKLLGATDAYILRPFLYLGVWYGVLGALVAVALITFFLFQFSHFASSLVSTKQPGLLIGLTLKQAYLLIGISGALGWLASQCFLRTKLASIETDNHI